MFPRQHICIKRLRYGSYFQLQRIFFCHQYLLTDKFLCVSRQEYRQHLTECEQQHVWYQNQMTAVEAQNKSLTNELACVKVNSSNYVVKK